MTALFLAITVFHVFPIQPIHSPSRIDRGELPGIAELRPWLCLAEQIYFLHEALGGLAGTTLWFRLVIPGCLLDGARLVGCNAGIAATT